MVGRAMDIGAGGLNPGSFLFYRSEAWHQTSKSNFLCVYLVTLSGSSKHALFLETDACILAGSAGTAFFDCNDASYSMATACIHTMLPIAWHGYTCSSTALAMCMCWYNQVVIQACMHVCYSGDINLNGCSYIYMCMCFYVWSLNKNHCMANSHNYIINYIYN